MPFSGQRGVAAREGLVAWGIFQEIIGAGWLKGAWGFLPAPSQAAQIFVERSISSLVKSLRARSESVYKRGRRARVGQRATEENGFFSELDPVQLFSPDIDYLEVAAVEFDAPRCPPE